MNQRPCRVTVAVVALVVWASAGMAAAINSSRARIRWRPMKLSLTKLSSLLGVHVR